MWKLCDSNAMSSASPNHGSCSRLPDSFPHSAQRENRTHPLLPQSSSNENSYSYSHGRYPQPSPINVFPSGGTSLAHTQSELQSTRVASYPEGPKHMSWCADSVEEFLHFLENVPDQNGLLDSTTGAIMSVDHADNTDWSDLYPLTTFEGSLEPNWDLSLDNAVDPKPQVLNHSSDILVQQPKIQQQQPAQSGESFGNPESESTAPSTKARMCWTQELHEAFLEAVDQLGGSDRATPKGILNVMKVEGLTIYHIKSHLQKYRTAKYKPEPSECTLLGACEKNPTPVEEINTKDLNISMGMTDALRLQVELQKQLHEQLETQRNLQLQIEEQQKYLEKMFEQQRKMENNMVVKQSSSTSNEPDKTGTGTPVDECSQDASMHQKAQASETRENHDPTGDADSDALPTKRARTE